MKIVSVDKVYISPEDIKRLKKFGEVIVYNDVPNEKEGIQRIKEADIVIDNWFDMPSRVISAAPALKMISVGAIGYEWVDIKEAKKRKIVVSNCPAYCAEAVAEHTIGLMLTAARLASMAQQDIRSEKWGPTQYRGKELKGMTLGVLGFGSIGKRVAEIAQKGLAMKILYFNTKSSKSEFEKLLKESDVIAVELPLTDKTKGILGKREFGLMKKGVIIVNTGRGAVIKEGVLIENIKSGKIFAAGLDVLSVEPMDKNNPLFSFPNVVITPHIAYNTESSRLNLSKIVTDNIIAFLKGKPQNVVN